jgi:hypothetical protein
MNKIRLALLALVVMSAVIISPSSASASITCNSGRVCTYWDINYNTSMYYYTGPTNYCIEIGEPWDNDISSVYNHTTYPVRFYQFHSCVRGGTLTTLPLDVASSTGVADLRNVQGVNFDNKFSSLWIGWSPP